MNGNKVQGKLINLNCGKDIEKKMRRNCIIDVRK